VIGNLSKTLEKAHDCSRDIHRLLVKEIKPGVCCADIYNLAVEEASSKGYGDFFMGHGEGHVKFVGHGIGLEIDEYPIITPRSKDKMQVGMVVAIEPKFVFPGKGVVGLEDDYLITPIGKAYIDRPDIDAGSYIIPAYFGLVHRVKTSRGWTPMKIYKSSRFTLIGSRLIKTVNCEPTTVNGYEDIKNFIY